MIEIKIDDETYTERQYKKDVARMFDSIRKESSEYMGSTNCYGVCCDDCPLWKHFGSCENSKADSFERIKIVHEWAIEHPIIRNREMLIKTFGYDVLHYIEIRPYKEKWFDEEYKKPKGE